MNTAPRGTDPKDTDPTPANEAPGDLSNDPPTERLPSLLAVFLDAETRETVFERLSRVGYRVDAVGDAASGRRRLDQDSYGAVLLEPGPLRDAVTSDGVPPETAILEVGADQLGDGVLEAQVAAAVQSGDSAE